jgi:hypothetical protein
VQGSTFKIITLCVNASQRCLDATGDYVFFLSVKNTGAVMIPAGPDNSVSFKGGINGTGKGFARTFNVTISAIPPGGSTSVGFTSWQTVFGAGNQPPFSNGTLIAGEICLWETQACQGFLVKAGS